MTYHHLSREERYQISALLKEGLIQAQIAGHLLWLPPLAQENSGPRRSDRERASVRPFYAACRRPVWCARDQVHISKASSGLGVSTWFS
jgi:hypothetical protein